MKQTPSAATHRRSASKPLPHTLSLARPTTRRRGQRRGDEAARPREHALSLAGCRRQARRARRATVPPRSPVLGRLGLGFQISHLFIYILCSDPLVSCVFGIEAPHPLLGWTSLFSCARSSFRARMRLGKPRGTHLPSLSLSKPTIILYFAQIYGKRPLLSMWACILFG